MPVFLFSKCDKYSELQLFRQAVMKLIMKIVHAIYYVIAEWNLYCAVRVGCLKSHLMMELFLPCILILQILLGICMVVKSAFSVRHICLSAHVSVAPTGQISMKFYLQTWLKSYKYIRHFLWRHKYILFFSVTQIYHKSIFVQHSLFLCC